MATIVREKQTGHSYVLVGTGFGAYHASTDHWFFGSLAPTKESGQYPMICVCDHSGRLGWFHTDAIEVVSIDGQPVSEFWRD